MKIKIIVIGKTKDKYFQEAESEFVKRISGFAQVEELVLKEEDKGNIEQIKKAEGGKILEKLDNDCFNIALDQNGKNLASEEFAKLIREQRDFGKGKISFIIGGTYGLSNEVLSKVDFKFSFSKMTFTHIMIRVFLLEQIYRAFTIIKGKKYHY